MKIFAAILILVVNICYGQETFDKRFIISISPTDSVCFASNNKYQTTRDSIAEKYSNWHQSARALEKYLLEKENPGVTRDKNDLIEIKLLNGEVLKLKPDVNRDEADFTFEAYFKELKFLLFRVQWGEGNNYALIDFISGKKTYIIGRPFFSPDNKLMMAINCDLDARYSANGFEMFEFANRAFKKIWSYDPKDWGPVDLQWTDNVTITSKNIMETVDKINTSYTKINVIRTTR